MDIIQQLDATFLASPWFWVYEMVAAVTFVFIFVGVSFYRLSK